jgi:hypothetical protein
MQHGECWGTMTSEDNIEENESGLLPTVTKELFSNWTSALGRIENNGRRKSGVKIGSIFWWHMTETHIRLGGAVDKTLKPDPSCGEVLMGWPMGWTESNASGTDKFRQWRLSHSKCFPLA